MPSNTRSTNASISTVNNDYYIHFSKPITVKRSAAARTCDTFASGGFFKNKLDQTPGHKLKNLDTKTPGHKKTRLGSVPGFCVPLRFELRHF